MKIPLRCQHGKLKRFFLILLCLGIFVTIISYQGVFQVSEIYRLDSPTVCNIPVVVNSKSAQFLIGVAGRVDGTPPCIGASVKFSIDYGNSSLVRDDSDEDYWKSLDCCYTVYHTDPNRTVINGVECFPIASTYTSIPHHHINLDIKCSSKETSQILYRDQLPVFRVQPSIEAEVDEILSKISSERMSVLVLGSIIFAVQSLHYIPP